MYKSKSNSMSDKSISMKRCACARWPKNILLYMILNKRKRTDYGEILQSFPKEN